MHQRHGRAVQPEQIIKGVCVNAAATAAENLTMKKGDTVAADMKERRRSLFGIVVSECLASFFFGLTNAKGRRASSSQVAVDDG